MWGTSCFGTLYAKYILLLLFILHAISVGFSHGRNSQRSMKPLFVVSGVSRLLFHFRFVKSMWGASCFSTLYAKCP